MRLVEVRFEHFQCLYNTHWVPTHDLTVLIGQNDCGKTAALNAIAILLGEADATIDDIAFPPGPISIDAATHQPVRESYLLIEGRFRPEASDALAERGIPKDDCGHAQISYRLGSDGKQQWLARGLLPVDEDLRIHPPDQHINDLRTLLRAKNEPSPGGNRKEPYVRAVEQLIARSPKTMESKGFASPPHADLFEVVDFTRAQDAETVLDNTLGRLFRDTIRSNRFPQLARVEREVTRILQASANELGDFIKRHRPDITDVIVRPNVDFSRGYRSVQIDVADRRGSQIPLAKRGEGLRSHLRLAAFEWSSQILAAARPRSAQAAATRVVLLDEPDTHLDYQAQRSLLRAVEEYARHAQVLVATHSVSLVNGVSLDHVVHLEVDGSSGQSSARTIVAPPGTEAGELNRIGQSLGIDNAVILYERCFFVFEGETEAAALPRMYELWSRSKWYLDGVRFINGHNDEGAIHFARYLHLNGRAVIALVDEDITQKSRFPRQFTRRPLEQHALLPADRIKTIGPSFFELAFSSSVWSRAIHRATGGRRRVGRSKLDSLRRTPKEFLEHLQRASGGMSKPELGAALASVLKRNEVPAALAEAFEAARRLAAG
jgi:energy-coupling factor transporter ATP-binding protein EcfA2